MRERTFAGRRPPKLKAGAGVGLLNRAAVHLLTTKSDYVALRKTKTGVEIVPIHVPAGTMAVTKVLDYTSSHRGQARIALRGVKLEGRHDIMWDEARGVGRLVLET